MTAILGEHMPSADTVVEASLEFKTAPALGAPC